jgi:uncharacterized protein YutE (UPF0331/DUF86 family)
MWKVAEAEFVAEPALHDLAERYLHRAFEACLDLANRAAPRFHRFDYSGKDMFQTLGDITSNTTAAMLFVDFGTGATLSS